jgi:heme-degrading monooxygenase HmoA
MYGRLVMVKLVSGARPTVEQLADEISPILRNMKGFKGLTIIIDEERDEYGSLSIWETREDAEAVTAVTGPQLTHALSDVAKGPPTIRIFDIYEPKEPAAH